MPLIIVAHLADLAPMEAGGHAAEWRLLFTGLSRPPRESQTLELLLDQTGEPTGTRDYPCHSRWFWSHVLRQTRATRRRALPLDTIAGDALHRLWRGIGALSVQVYPYVGARKRR